MRVELIWWVHMISEKEEFKKWICGLRDDINLACYIFVQYLLNARYWTSARCWGYQYLEQELLNDREFEFCSMKKSLTFVVQHCDYTKYYLTTH